jgi:hypothetical protein
MTTTPITPRRVEFAGPEGWIVWADEDGVHIGASTAGFRPGLEQPDAERLFELWQQVRAMKQADHIPAPKPPTREQIREDGYLRAEEQVKRRALRAVEREFGDTETAPF